MTSSPISQPSFSERSDAWRLLTLGWLSLFLQLALLRYLAANFWNFGYFPNLVLLASFLGLGLGFVLSHFVSEKFSQRFAFLAPLLFMGMVLWVSAYHPAIPGFSTDYGDIHGEYFPTHISPHQRSRPEDLSRLVLCFFWLTALFFCIAQDMARLFRRFRSITAYTLEIGGAGLGILSFMTLSFLCCPPSVWFLLLVPVFSGVFYYRMEPWQRVVVFFCVLSSAGIAHTQDQEIHAIPYQVPQHQTRWSPYQKVNFALLEHGTEQQLLIFLNGLYQQHMVLPHAIANSYGSPYLQRRQKQVPFYRHVLILGAGVGNDVAAAIHYGADLIDAVDIDPVIPALSLQKHPARPYRDQRVQVWIMDGRQFLAQTRRKYDLILFAHTHSFLRANPHIHLRQENYLFTVEAFRQAYRLLQPDGDLVVYGIYPKPWLRQRLHDLLHAASGQIPQPIPSSQEYTVLMLNKPLQHPTPPAQSQPAGLSLPGQVVSSSSRPQSRSWLGWWSAPFKTHPAPMISARPVPHDDWPFFYLPRRAIPYPYKVAFVSLAGLVLLIVLLVSWMAPKESCHPSESYQSPESSISSPVRLSEKWAFLLLGCSFLLLESKGIVQFSLWFGTTWYNHAFVFLAILVLILLASRLALIVNPLRWPVVMVLLFLSCAVVLWFPASVLLLIANPIVRLLWASLLTFSPLFFSSLLFGLLFRDRAIAGHLLGWNLLGAVLGAALETLALRTGYHALSWLIVGLYTAICLCLVLAKRLHPTTPRSI